MLYRNYGILLLICWLHTHVWSQQTILQFNDENLVSIIKQLEGQTNYTFNYDPSLLIEYSFSGKLSLESPNLFLTKLFLRTPITFELIDQDVLIYQDQMKKVKVCGRVLDLESQTPLPFANIFSDNSMIGSQSDESGYFEFELTALKHQQIRASYVGYQSKEYFVQTFLDQGCIEILLDLDKQLLGQEIIVRDYIIDGISEGQDYSSVEIDYHQLSNWQTNIEQDIMKAVQLLPGINSIDGSATNLNIRGGSSDQNLVLWEGAKLYDPGHFFGMVSSINPFVVDKVSIHKGVFNPSYDNVVGGVIDIALPDSIPEQLHGGFGTTFTEAHAFFDIPIIPNKLSILGSGRNTLTPFIQTPTLVSYSTKVFQDSKINDPEAPNNKQILNYYDWNVKLLFQPIHQLSFKFSLFRARNQFNYSTDWDKVIGSVDEVFTNTNALNGSLTWTPNKRWKSQLSFFQSGYDNDYYFQILDLRDLVQEVEIQLQNSINDQSLLFVNDWQLSRFHSFSIGYEYNIKEVNFNFLESSIYEPDFTDLNFSVGHFHNPFVSFDYQNDQFSFNAGLRATYYEEPGDWGLTPRINIQRAFNPFFKVNLSIGSLIQYIGKLRSFGFNDLNITNQIWVLNRTDLHENAFQRAFKTSLGGLFQRNGWLLNLDGYYHKTNGLNTYSPTLGNTAREADLSFGSSQVLGLDALIKKRWGNYSIWLNYTFNDATFIFSEIVEDPFPASKNQRHNLSLIQNIKWDKWNFSLVYQHKSGLPFTQPFGFEFIEEEEFEYYEIQLEDWNGDQLPDHSILNLGINYQTRLNSDRSKFGFAVSLINLFNNRNTFERNYYLTDIDEEEDGEPELYFVDKSLLRRTVQFLMRWKW